MNHRFGISSAFVYCKRADPDGLSHTITESDFRRAIIFHTAGSDGYFTHRALLDGQIVTVSHMPASDFDLYWSEINGQAA